MIALLRALVHGLVSSFRGRASLQLEIMALRHQLEALQRQNRGRVRLSPLDRACWSLLYRFWPRCLDAIVIVKPDTVVSWHRKGFRLYWTWKSQSRKRGRPETSAEAKMLICRMSRENPLWGAPRIHGELRKLGIEISQATVSRYMIRHPKPPSQRWHSFLKNHACCIVGVDFFVVPTLTFRILFVFIVLHHARRQIVHVGVTAHPASHWAAQQIREAFSWESTPEHLVRDRDRSYGKAFCSRLQAMGIKEVLIAPRAPWQNAHAERVIGSIRRECLDHVIVVNERHLRRVLRSYLAYYHKSRTHLSLDKDCPDPRPVQPPGPGKIVALPQLGGIHHRYERLAA
jgi:putative transposase